MGAARSSTAASDSVSPPVPPSTVNVLLVADPSNCPPSSSRTGTKHTNLKKKQRGRNTDLKIVCRQGTTTFHDVLVRARELTGENKLYFVGNVDVLAKPLQEVEHHQDNRVFVGYEDSSGSIVPADSVNTLMVVIRHDENGRRAGICLRPVVSVPVASSFIGSQLVHMGLTTRSVELTMKSMQPITTVHYISADRRKVLKLDSKRLGVDLDDATARHIVAYIEREFKLTPTSPYNWHLEVNGHQVVLRESMDCLLREWAPHGGRVTVATRPDLSTWWSRRVGNGEIKIYVKALTGKLSSYVCFRETAVAGLKRMIEASEGIPPDQQRLIFNGKQLEDGLMLGVDYSVEDRSTLFLILRLRGGMYHPTSGRHDFCGLDHSDVLMGRPVNLLLPDGTRTRMNIQTDDSMMYLTRMAEALVDETRARENQVTNQGGPESFSVRRLRLLLYDAKEKYKFRERELREAEMEKERMRRAGAGRELMEDCKGRVAALSLLVLNESAQVIDLGGQLIKQLEGSKQSAKSGQPPAYGAGQAEREATLVTLLQREAEMRTDPSTLRAMAMAEESEASEWMDVAARIQHQIIEEHGDEDITVHDLRVAALRHPEICFWVRFNRSRRGQLAVGGPAPDVRLLKAHNGEATPLFTARGKTDRTVVVAGSWS
jgi:hypothetical protein